VIHHFLCAYVGPRYDYAATERSIACPKCRIELRTDGEDNEVVGYCCKCPACSREYGWGA
jgi:hypothetical protein